MNAECNFSKLLGSFIGDNKERCEEILNPPFEDDDDDDDISPIFDYIICHDDSECFIDDIVIIEDTLIGIL